MGARLRDNGIAFHYHNHDYEFEIWAGTTAMDLLDGLDNVAVDLCLDVGWVYVARIRAPSSPRTARTGYLHLKDYERPAGQVGRGAPGASGNGDVNWDEVMELARPKGSSGQWSSRTAATRAGREPTNSRDFLRTRYNY